MIAQWPRDCDVCARSHGADDVKRVLGLALCVGCRRDLMLLLEEATYGGEECHGQRGEPCRRVK